MKKTRLCELLGVENPVILGAMTCIATDRLTAAVSSAGGLCSVSTT